LDIFEVIVFAVGVFFFIYLLIMRPHKISGQSMMPNYQDSEYLLTQKVSYYLNKPQRGDVVVLVPPPSVSQNDEFIKRIIGLPGETIRVSGGHVYINGKILDEPYIASNVYTGGGTFLSEDTDFTVPEDEYFLMGDNRPNSSDSRYWGPVPLNLSPASSSQGINGKVWITYWPPNLAGVVHNPSYTY